MAGARRIVLGVAACAVATAAGTIAIMPGADLTKRSAAAAAATSGVSVAVDGTESVPVWRGEHCGAGFLGDVVVVCSASDGRVHVVPVAAARDSAATSVLPIAEHIASLAAVHADTIALWARDDGVVLYLDDEFEIVRRERFSLTDPVLSIVTRGALAGSGLLFEVRRFDGGVRETRALLSTEGPVEVPIEIGTVTAGTFKRALQLDAMGDVLVARGNRAAVLRHPLAPAWLISAAANAMAVAHSHTGAVALYTASGQRTGGWIVAARLSPPSEDALHFLYDAFVQGGSGADADLRERLLEISVPPLSHPVLASVVMLADGRVVTGLADSWDAHTPRTWVLFDGSGREAGRVKLARDLDILAARSGMLLLYSQSRRRVTVQHADPFDEPG